MLPRRKSQWKGTVPEDSDDVAAPEDLEDVDEADIDALEDGDEALEDLEVDDLEDDDLEDDALADDDDDDDALADDDTDDAVAAVVVEGAEGVPATAAPAAEEGDDDDDEEPDDEDVEASLDVILKERLVVEEEPEDDEPTDAEDRSEATERVLPKQPDEFVCRSCFLVKHASQLADRKRGLCRDCV
jgi:hypothetical protein